MYRLRWHAELDLRALKQSTGMDELRCKAPEMVRKELWVHLLGYNLVRGVMAQSGSVSGVAPRCLSFTGAAHTLLAWAGVLSGAGAVARAEILGRLWVAVGAHRVGNRPGRVEPRAIKRRKKSYPLLNEPRNLARQRLLQTA